MKVSVSQPISVGIVAALVGFTSSFAVVLAGLDNVGASAAQATLGLMALNFIQGAMNVWLSLRHRKPFMTAWSTPGAAVLISVAGVQGGWPAAVGAFIVTGLLIFLTGLWPLLGRLIAMIPAPVAQAMLAGVLLMICIAPVVALAANPVLVAPIILVWLLLMRFAQRWATPAAFLLALVMIGWSVMANSSHSFSIPAVNLAPTMPTLTVSAVVGIAIPLYIVTMASQNFPGAAVMKAYGYEVPWRESLLLTGTGTVVGATFGTHALNLAAITAALTASSEAHPNPNKRWIASTSAGCTYIVLGFLTPLLTAMVAASPDGLIETVAGLALISTLVVSLAEAFRNSAQRIATGLTFIVAASPITLFGVGAAFWGLVVGLIAWAVFRKSGAVALTTTTKVK